MKMLSKSNVFIAGMGGVGIEIGNTQHNSFLPLFQSLTTDCHI